MRTLQTGQVSCPGLTKIPFRCEVALLVMQSKVGLMFSRIFSLSELFLIFPLQLEDNRFSVSKWRATVCFVLNATIMASGVYILILNPYSSSNGKLDLYYKAHIIALLCILPVSSFLRVKTLNNFFRSFQAVDTCLRCHIDVTPVSTFAIRLLTNNFILTVCYSAYLTKIGFDWVPVELFFHSASFLTVILITLQIHGFLGAIQKRLFILNNNFRKSGREYRIGSLITVTSIHRKLLDLVDILNALYSFHLLALMFIVLVGIMMFFFYFYDCLFINKQSFLNTIRSLIDSSLWSVNYFCVIWSIVSSQEDLTIQVLCYE